MSRLARFAAVKTATAIGVLLAMITITFVIFWAVPSEPAAFVYPSAQHLSNDQIHRADHLLGLDRPKVVQYGSYLWHLAQGDFGGSWSGASITPDQKLVKPAIAPRLIGAARVTGSIVLGGAVLVLLLAVPLGAIAARFRDSAVDRTISLLTLIGICTHPMVVGLLLRTVFGNRLGWLPPTGYCNFFTSSSGGTTIVPDSALSSNLPCSGPGAWAEHLVLPWITFALLYLALYTRLVRASILDEAAEDYVRTARAKGVGEIRLLARHVLPNAALPVLTLIGIEVGTALGVAVYIESAYGMPGLGRLSVSVLVGTIGLDLPVILATITLVTAIVLVGNLVVDLLYAVIDPRIEAGARTRTARGRSGNVF